MNNLTFKQYRNIDICIFSFLLLISEAVTTLATNVWFAAQPIAITTTFIFICIVMMRWNWYAIVPAVIGGAVFCIASGASTEQFLIYAVGNCATLVNLIWFKIFKKEDVRTNAVKLVLFVLTAYITMQLGRWLVSLIFIQSLDSLVIYLTTDIITLLFAVVVMLILRNVDGMIEDQKTYLFRLQRELDAEKKQVDSFDEIY